VDNWVEIANEGTGSIIKVHAGKGNNTATDLYNSALVWNRKGDIATLKDATGKNVSEYKYPVMSQLW
jgi:hypothetical protein